MRKMYYSLKYIFNETFISLRKSGMLILCAIIIITTALISLGLFILADRAASAVISGFENNLEIVAFLEDGFNASTLKNVIIPNISNYPEVASVRLVTKEDAREELKKEVPELRDVFSIIEENPLPSSLRIKVKTPDTLAAVTDRMKKENGLAIEEITYGGENANSFLKASQKFRESSLFVLIIFIIASVVVIAATIRLTVYSRFNEIEIMRLVGATDWYIKWPYILEGIFLGVVSGALATLAVLFIKNGVFLELSKSFIFLKNIAEGVNIFDICWKLILVGILQGIIGAMFSTASVLSEKK